MDDWLYVLFVHVSIKLSVDRLLCGCTVLMNHLKIYGIFLETCHILGSKLLAPHCGGQGLSF